MSCSQIASEQQASMTIVVVFLKSRVQCHCLNTGLSLRTDLCAFVLNYDALLSSGTKSMSPLTTSLGFSRCMQWPHCCTMMSLQDI